MTLRPRQHDASGNDPRGAADPGWRLALLYDGDCPLCRREVAFMRRLDRGRDHLRPVDIADPRTDLAAWSSGRSRAELMAEIHARTPAGGIVTGMEAFRRAYRALGYGWLLGWTAWPGLRWLSDRGYAWFARNRLRLTGRCDACAADR